MKRLSVLAILFIALTGLLVSMGCKKDKDDEPVVLKDADGNVYTSVVIGTQEWMKENLRTTRYRNGDPITHAPMVNDWKTVTEGKYCAYDNDGGTVVPYGYLYSWIAVSDPRHLCPAGWHVASRADWDTLIGFLGGAYAAGGKLKQTGTTSWNSVSSGTTNESGFTALPGGVRNYTSADFFGLSDEGHWWTSTENPNNSTMADRDYLRAISDIIQYNPASKNFGFSVRCVKD
ncbi:MAG: fibrobacter succinogenes major paralogous domain-containing protein [Bacteroidales bacterium]